MDSIPEEPVAKTKTRLAPPLYINTGHLPAKHPDAREYRAEAASLAAHISQADSELRELRQRKTDEVQALIHETRLADSWFPPEKLDLSYVEGFLKERAFEAKLSQSLDLEREKLQIQVARMEGLQRQYAELQRDKQAAEDELLNQLRNLRYMVEARSKGKEMVDKLASCEDDAQ